MAMMVNQLGEMAWIKMGLQADPITGQTDKDMVQAKYAVDAASALSDQLMPHLDEEDSRQIQNLVRDLRVNFVQKSEV